ncbi:MAG: amidohydrolase [Gammaproteobacteria bacterium]|jgi:imidazolonepropionase-like amidohydrolase|nr:amidohydrolase [Gammaproteobacteria bacterium]MDP7455997.1 amidohydrolase family protein [Gammaproteobacteria bacterium]HJO11985.1 amidohydrolase family protein [Gammaproteobacteria bacterium]|tara:strand:- start:7134 stop:8417 length:1284 start_codon:yes stop_codon:yes gene_type:complete
MKKIISVGLVLLGGLLLHWPSVFANEGSIAFVGARIIDGTDAAPLEDGVIVITDGRIRTVGPRSAVTLPAGTQQIDVSGKTIIPGLINAHGHVGGTLGLEGGHYNTENLERQLSLYARYGVTTVNSLGGDEAQGFQLRDSQYSADLERARILVSGSVVVGNNEAAVRSAVNSNADMGANFIKVRVDDNLGNTSKMPQNLLEALVDQAHIRRLPVAVHLFYQDDAKFVLNAGADLIAHSVRDEAVDQQLISLINDKDVCYIPTLTREVSTFVYESEPFFFADPFFLKEVEPAILATLREPERQSRMRNSSSAQQYKAALEVAMANVGTLSNNGVKIAMGTDTGPAARFQGYFEHMELQMMVDSGMSPLDAIRSATGVAAECINAGDIGTLEPGKWGDLVVLNENPADNIENTKTVDSVWIAGNEVPGN